MNEQLNSLLLHSAVLVASAFLARFCLQRWGFTPKSPSPASPAQPSEPSSESSLCHDRHNNHPNILLHMK